MVKEPLSSTELEECRWTLFCLRGYISGRISCLALLLSVSWSQVVVVTLSADAGKEEEKKNTACMIMITEKGLEFSLCCCFQ